MRFKSVLYYSPTEIVNIYKNIKQDDHLNIDLLEKHTQFWPYEKCAVTSWSTVLTILKTRLTELSKHYYVPKKKDSVEYEINEYLQQCIFSEDHKRETMAALSFLEAIFENTSGRTQINFNDTLCCYAYCLDNDISLKALYLLRVIMHKQYRSIVLKYNKKMTNLFMFMGRITENVFHFAGSEFYAENVDIFTLNQNLINTFVNETDYIKMLIKYKQVRDRDNFLCQQHIVADLFLYSRSPDINHNLNLANILAASYKNIGTQNYTVKKTIYDFYAACMEKRYKVKNIYDGLRVRLYDGEFMTELRNIYKKPRKFVQSFFNFITTCLTSKNDALNFITEIGLLGVFKTLLDVEVQERYEISTIIMKTCIAKILVMILENRFLQLGQTFFENNFHEFFFTEIVNCYEKVPKQDYRNTVMQGKIFENPLLHYYMVYLRYLLLCVDSFYALVQTNASEHDIVDLLESKFLSSMQHILLNRNSFSSEILNHLFSIITNYINAHPLNIVIFEEKDILSLILDIYNDLPKNSNNIIYLVDIINGLSLKNEYLELIIENNIIRKIFTTLLDKNYLECFTITDISSQLGVSFEELLRHHPKYKTAIYDECLFLLSSLIAADICDNDTRVTIVQELFKESESYNIAHYSKGVGNMIPYQEHTKNVLLFIDSLILVDTFSEAEINKIVDKIMDLVTKETFHCDFDFDFIDLFNSIMGKSNSPESLNKVYQVLCEKLDSVINKIEIDHIEYVQAVMSTFYTVDGDESQSIMENTDEILNLNSTFDNEKMIKNLSSKKINVKNIDSKQLKHKRGREKIASKPSFTPDNIYDFLHSSIVVNRILSMMVQILDAQLPFKIDHLLNKMLKAYFTVEQIFTSFTSCAQIAYFNNKPESYIDDTSNALKNGMFEFPNEIRYTMLIYMMRNSCALLYFTHIRLLERVELLTHAINYTFSALKIEKDKDQTEIKEILSNSYLLLCHIGNLIVNKNACVISDYVEQLIEHIEMFTTLYSFNEGENQLKNETKRVQNVNTEEKKEKARFSTHHNLHNTSRSSTQSNPTTVLTNYYDHIDSINNNLSDFSQSNNLCSSLVTSVSSDTDINLKLYEKNDKVVDLRNNKLLGERIVDVYFYIINLIMENEMFTLNDKCTEQILNLTYKLITCLNCKDYANVVQKILVYYFNDEIKSEISYSTFDNQDSSLNIKDNDFDRNSSNKSLKNHEKVYLMFLAQKYTNDTILYNKKYYDFLLNIKCYKIVNEMQKRNICGFFATAHNLKNIAYVNGTNAIPESHDTSIERQDLITVNLLIFYFLSTTYRFDINTEYKIQEPAKGAPKGNLDRIEKILGAFSSDGLDKKKLNFTYKILQQAVSNHEGHHSTTNTFKKIYDKKTIQELINEACSFRAQEKLFENINFIIVILKLIEGNIIELHKNKIFEKINFEVLFTLVKHKQCNKTDLLLQLMFFYFVENENFLTKVVRKIKACKNSIKAHKNVLMFRCYSVVQKELANNDIEIDCNHSITDDQHEVIYLLKRYVFAIDYSALALQIFAHLILYFPHFTNELKEKKFWQKFFNKLVKKENDKNEYCDQNRASWMINFVAVIFLRTNNNTVKKIITDVIIKNLKGKNVKNVNYMCKFMTGLLNAKIIMNEYSCERECMVKIKPETPSHHTTTLRSSTPIVRRRNSHIPTSDLNIEVTEILDELAGRLDNTFSERIQFVDEPMSNEEQNRLFTRFRKEPLESQVATGSQIIDIFFEKKMPDILLQAVQTPETIPNILALLEQLSKLKNANESADDSESQIIEFHDSSSSTESEMNEFEDYSVDDEDTEFEEEDEFEGEENEENSLDYYLLENKTVSIVFQKECKFTSLLDLWAQEFNSTLTKLNEIYFINELKINEANIKDANEVNVEEITVPFDNTEHQTQNEVIGESQNEATTRENTNSANILGAVQGSQGDEIVNTQISSTPNRELTARQTLVPHSLVAEEEACTYQEGCQCIDCISQQSSESSVGEFDGVTPNFEPSVLNDLPEDILHETISNYYDERRSVSTDYQPININFLLTLNDRARNLFEEYELRFRDDYRLDEKKEEQEIDLPELKIRDKQALIDAKLVDSVLKLVQHDISQKTGLSLLNNVCSNANIRKMIMKKIIENLKCGDVETNLKILGSLLKHQSDYIIYLDIHDINLIFNCNYSDVFSKIYHVLGDILLLVTGYDTMKLIIQNTTDEKIMFTDCNNLVSVERYMLNGLNGQYISDVVKTASSQDFKQDEKNSNSENDVKKSISNERSTDCLNSGQNSQKISTHNDNSQTKDKYSDMYYYSDAYLDEIHFDKSVCFYLPNTNTIFNYSTDFATMNIMDSNISYFFESHLDISKLLDCIKESSSREILDYFENIILCTENSFARQYTEFIFERILNLIDGINLYGDYYQDIIMMYFYFTLISQIRIQFASKSSNVSEGVTSSYYFDSCKTLYDNYRTKLENHKFWQSFFVFLENHNEHAMSLLNVFECFCILRKLRYSEDEHKRIVNGDEIEEENNSEAEVLPKIINLGKISEKNQCESEYKLADQSIASNKIITISAISDDTIANNEHKKVDVTTTNEQIDISKLDISGETYDRNVKKFKTSPESEETLKFALFDAKQYEKFNMFFRSMIIRHSIFFNRLFEGNISTISKTCDIVLYYNVLDFNNKIRYLKHIFKKQGVATIYVNVERSNLVEDSYTQIMNKTGKELRQGKLHVKFGKEEGVDVGGLTREFYALLSKEIVNPDYYLFTLNQDGRTYSINKSSHVNAEHLLFFRFIGRIIAKGIIDNILTDIHFTIPFYKQILGKKLIFSDLELVDLPFYRSLKWMQDNNIEGVIDCTFSLQYDEFGVTKTYDLIENGRAIKVDETNKKEYIELMANFHMTKNCEKQVCSFNQGFYEVLEKKYVKVFNEKELELLISGLPEIDVDDWRNNTEYHGYKSTSLEIQWFWRCVRGMNNEDKATLLQFVTGTSKLPIEGFKALQGSNGRQKFQIHAGNKGLPCAHTCFNQLDLPKYKSYEELVENLLYAIRECSTGFGFA